MAAKAEKVEVAAEWVRIADLTPWDKNPRKDQPSNEVARSIVEFGWGAPVIARRDGKGVVAGHTRLKAAALLPGWWSHASEEDRATWSADARRIATEADPRVPCRFMDLTDAQAKALALADNRLGELADWDEALLSETLRELNADGFDLGSVGWDDAALDTYLSGTGAVPPAAPPAGSGVPPKADDKGIEYQNKYAVVVACTDEPHQMRVFEHLTGLGYAVKVLAL